ncbi:MAG: hypothetical protein US71_C0009G0009 [Parcubacteria group bacterium GW2011_GWD2_38_12]|nr:MAG: hypothetical protein US06_C0011G0009 [Parcubacteria group bacterium GW2011_GWC2_36_17]KKQ40191.1 MAG: hypothetical protein US56_C0007G0009 [Candidatus Moranbacteria bacterium GW2011_GWF2_37_7]KKQ51642.1 MAG: hypothetical protein US71_C0009G0009 [Parcubacteria group bacterium GW2011_GWD2_38_12]KKQ58741.1 MAG: hypothetical protein US79_C0003G0042 [Parcubacteria group bacterium GW2011_GWC1_38_17]KKQ59361.1 MAG: hypothetical protein US78_C0005G0019 [Parcubacteria group bacterium GW2011_GWD1
MKFSKSQIIKKIREIVEKMFSGIGPCHDFYHTKRVLKVAKYLAKKEKADMFIVELAALLHDIGRIEEYKHKYHKAKLNHADLSAKNAIPILKKFKLPEKTINDIYHAIIAHRFRNPTEKAHTIEAKILRDADKLDSIGAIGIARAYIWLGEYRIGTIYVGKSEWSKFNINSKDPKHDSLQREWAIKLSKIKNQMFTKSGKQLAIKRHKLMEKFLKNLEKEIKFA